MPPKSRKPGPGQGSFLEIEAVHSSQPNLPAPAEVHFEVVPEGIFPPEPSTVEQALPQTIEFIERLDTLRKTRGFMPTSLGEGNEAFALLSYIDTSAGSAGHVNEILQHQIKHKEKQEREGREVKIEDPTAAVRSVTNEYAGYALRARTDVTALSALQTELADIQHANPFLSLRELNLQNGIRQLVRFVDLSNLAAGRPVDIRPFIIRADKRRSALDPYIIPEPSREMLAHMDSVLGNTRLWQARRLVQPAINDQSNRRDFWTERVVELDKHIAARPIARRALRALGVTLEGVSK
jgi:hypothetical protein